MEFVWFGDGRRNNICTFWIEVHFLGKERKKNGQRFVTTHFVANERTS